MLQVQYVFEIVKYCMRKWRQGWHYVHLNAKIEKSLLAYNVQLHACLVRVGQLTILFVYDIIISFIVFTEGRGLWFWKHKNGYRKAATNNDAKSDAVWFLLKNCDDEIFAWIGNCNKSWDHIYGNFVLIGSIRRLIFKIVSLPAVRPSFMTRTDPLQDIWTQIWTWISHRTILTDRSITC